MTREEAIARIKDHKIVHKMNEPRAILISEALDMAIEALEQQPCNDAISRQYLLDNCVVDKATMPYVPVNKIKNAPPVTQKPIECDDAISRILARMWNCRGKHTTSIDKVAMEQIIRDELPSVMSKSIECEDAISREDALNSLIENTDFEGWELSQALEAIEKLPSVTQKSKYWIDKDSKLYKMPDDIPTMTIQYPTITHGDTISRTEVMKVISDFVALEKYIDEHNHITFEPLEKMINALPSVTHKSGKWILLDECANSGYYCSRCQKKLVKEGWSDTVKKIKFCPNCGAKMVEPQESEE